MAFSPLDIVGGILSGADAAGPLLGPWRFFFSREYREFKRVEWRSRPPYIAQLQQLGGIISLTLQVVIVAMLAALIFHAYRPS